MLGLCPCSQPPAAPPCPAGQGPGCGSACGSRSCPEGYCSNGGHCHLHPVTCAPACACPSAFTDQHCLVAGGDFRPLPSTGGCLCLVGDEPQPRLPRSWDARIIAVASPRQIFPGEASGCVSGHCKTPLLRTSMALYVAGGDGLGEGDAPAHQAAWQLGVPVPLCAPLAWDPWGSSRSAGPEGGSASHVMPAEAVAMCQVPSA